MVIQERILDRSSFSTNSYLKEISKTPLLTKKEEEKYVKAYQGGDENAREILIKSNLRFVVSVANTYQNHKVKIGDLINEGNIGLIESIEHYKLGKGARLLSYSIWYIQRRIFDFLSLNNDIFDISITKTSQIRKLKKEIIILENEIGRQIYPSDLYSKIDGMVDYQIDNIFELISNQTLSISQEIGDESILTLGDTLTSSYYDDVLNQETQADNLNTLEELVNGLEPRLRKLMNDFHGLNGHKKIGEDGYCDKYNLTLTRVRQLHDVAIRHLKSLVSGKTTRYKKPTEETRVRSYTPIVKNCAGIDYEVGKSDYVIEDESIFSKVKMMFKKLL